MQVQHHRRGSVPRLCTAAGIAASLIAVALVGLATPGAQASTGLQASTGVQAAAPLSALLVTPVDAFSATDSSVYKTARATCPAGQEVIGTGYQLQGAEGDIVLDDLIPSRNSVLVGAGEVVGKGEPADGTTLNWRVRATAMCVRSGLGLTIVSGTESVFAVGASRAAPSANCPLDTFAFGFGASLNNGFGQVGIDQVQTDSEDLNRVNAHASTDDDGYTDPWSITAYAICGSPTAIPGYARLTGFSSFNNQAVKQGAANCGSGQAALSVGWLADSGNRVTVSQAETGVPAGPPVNGGSASAYVRRAGFSGNWGISAQLICATGSNIVGGVNMQDACDSQYPGRGLQAHLFDTTDALSWSCWSPANNTRLGISVDAECARMYGTGTVSYLISRADPGSWRCRR